MVVERRFFTNNSVQKSKKCGTIDYVTEKLLAVLDENQNGSNEQRKLLHITAVHFPSNSSILHFTLFSLKLIYSFGILFVVQQQVFVVQLYG